ncbi:hypothetical protein ACFV6F_14535 [Kitasatospora phosalacinea]|uniref:hypothetical protein n=1 Tax=Kitasatospora phosalacinea TaxID=2065 RepID=UPI0036562387
MRLTGQWSDDRTAFRSRGLSDRHYVRAWVDGVQPEVRPGQARSCVLVLLGARPDGAEEPVREGQAA